MKMPRAIACLMLAGAVSFLTGAEGVPATTYVDEDAAGKLDILGEVAVVMTGNDPFINRIMEDVLAVELLSRGIVVAYPEEADFGKPGRRDDDPMAVARSVGAEALVTGMLVTEPPGDWQFRTVRVSIASLSLVDVPMDKTLIWSLYEPEEAVTATRIAREFAGCLVDNLK